MDRETLVDEIQKLGRELDEREGPLALLMLVSPDPSVLDDWTIVVSGRGFNGKTRAQAVRQLTDALRRTVSKRLWSKIRRATVLRTDDPFVTAITSVFSAENAPMSVESCNISGFEIPKAIVFTSKRVAA